MHGDLYLSAAGRRTGIIQSLFYAKNSEYIIRGYNPEAKSAPDRFSRMRVDMTGNGDISDFILQYSLNNWADFGDKLDLGFYSGELADGIAPSFYNNGVEASLWTITEEDLMRMIPYDSFGLTEVIPMIQITCAYGDSVKELFV